MKRAIIELRGWRAARAAVASLFAAAVLAAASPALAQGDPTEGARAWGKGSCSNCHSGLAEGGGQGEFPNGPSLRKSTLDRETFRETVACGRPGSEMPFNLTGAYVEVACWGLPLGDPPPEIISGARLSAEETDALIAFLFEYVVGVERITRAACGVFYGNNPDHPICAQYPR